MAARAFTATLRTIAEDTAPEELHPGSRYVFVSDLHLGDGSARDDFAHNEELFLGALESWYGDRGWTLVLNGDIEELHKFHLRDIRAAHDELYAAFGRFDAAGRLRKLVGNHDLALYAYGEDAGFPLREALRLQRGDDTIVALHGHQSSKFFMRYNRISDFIVRRIADPLGIPNADKPLTSRRRYKAERAIYRSARDLGYVVIAGHTHRPLFESYSKYDSIRWNLESLLRRYARAGDDERHAIVDAIQVYAGELKRLSRKERKAKVSRSLYEREEMLVPCLFNSGCATGRGGFTAVEIDGSEISLVHWTTVDRQRAYVERESIDKASVPGTPWVRYVLASDPLDYVFARLRLLA